MNFIIRRGGHFPYARVFSNEQHLQRVMMKTNKTTLAVMIASCFGSGLAMAEETQDTGKVLSPVVVTATRTEQDSFDLPMAIDKVDKKDIEGKPQMVLSESLSRIPGITAQSRTQMAQDPQISSRGFGARSSFGVRGLRVYVDGIPLSMPDGIGTPGSIDLNAVSGIEVMRGPFSAMYGNSSGGVIQLLTDTPAESPQVEGDFMAGSFQTYKESVRASGIKNGVDYLVSYSDYTSDGYRTQSGNRKQMTTAKLGVKISDDTKLTTLINWFDQDAKDPGGMVRTGTSTSEPGALTQNAYYNPSSATYGAINGKTRVSRSNTQVGFNLEKVLDANNLLNVIAYGGKRDNLQYLALGNSGNVSGRASSIARNFYGTDIRMTNKGELMARPYSVSFGINVGYMNDDRLDRNTTNGVIGTAAPNRDENQTARNIDQYVQGIWGIAEKWDVHAGMRHTRLDLEITPNPGATATPTGGSLKFDKTIPVVGIVFKATPTLNYYANLGKGFETPTLVEITYADPSVTNGGSNLTLKPSTSTNIEIGSKWIASDNARLNAALFNIETENEIVIDKLSGSTASYKNAGTTRRRGLELSAEANLPSNFSVYGAYTLLDARFTSQFDVGTGASGAGTLNAGTVKVGNYIPGTYKMQVYGELAWKHAPINFQTALEARYNSKVFVNDVNTESAPSNTVISLRASLKQKSGAWQFTEYARIDNLFDKAYIGSVRINDNNIRFYEPAPGRNWIVGVKANYAF